MCLGSKSFEVALIIIVWVNGGGLLRNQPAVQDAFWG